MNLYQHLRTVTPTVFTNTRLSIALYKIIDSSLIILFMNKWHEKPYSSVFTDISANTGVCRAAAIHSIDTKNPETKTPENIW